jgi:natural product precursor
MKTKRLSKKLTLNKNTIVNLFNTDMKKVYGGDTTGSNLCTMPTGCQETCNPAVCPSLEVMCG